MGLDQALGHDRGPQADRDHVSRGRLGVLQHRRPAGSRHPDGALHGRQDDHGGGHLQPGVHHARADHGVPVHHPVDSGDDGQLPPADHGGREGRGVPEAQSAESVRLRSGRLIMLYSITTGGVDTGWTFYTPYSKETGTAVIAMAMGAFVMGFSSILTGLNFIVTIHKMRAPGMTWNRMPLFLWSIYATSIVQILATPVIGITMVLLTMERVLGIGDLRPCAWR